MTTQTAKRPKAIESPQVREIISNLAERPAVHSANMIDALFIILCSTPHEEREGYDFESFKILLDLLQAIGDTPEGLGLIQ